MNKNYEPIYTKINGLCVALISDEYRGVPLFGDFIDVVICSEMVKQKYSKCFLRNSSSKPIRYVII